MDFEKIADEVFLNSQNSLKKSSSAITKKEKKDQKELQKLLYDVKRIASDV